MDTVGFVGLGRMGRPMARNLVGKGFPVIAWDTVPAALEGFEAVPVEALARRSDVVITMLPNSQVVREVVLGVLPAMAPGSLVMDMSTVSPATTDEMAAEARARGVGFVDAPVGRLASHADRGESLFMVGAEPDDFARVRPLLEAMGTTIHHCGGPGTGTRTKLVNNYLAIVSCQTNAEALTLAQRFGLSLEKTLEVIYGTTAVNGQIKIAWPSKVLAGDTQPGFTIDLAHKDLTLIVEAANALEVPMPVGAAAREAFSVARATGHGRNDFSTMVDALCDLAGVERPRFAAGADRRTLDAPAAPVVAPAPAVPASEAPPPTPS